MHHQYDAFKRRVPVLEFKPYGLRYSGEREEFEEEESKYTLSKCQFCQIYHPHVRVNGTDLHMQYDPGASKIALIPEDAARLGFNIEELVFDVSVGTADSVSKAARVTLKMASIGNLKAHNVPALVMSGGTRSLLGMSFLNRFNHGIYNDQLVIEKKDLGPK